MLIDQVHGTTVSEAKFSLCAFSSLLCSKLFAVCSPVQLPTCAYNEIFQRSVVMLQRVNHRLHQRNDGRVGNQ